MIARISTGAKPSGAVRYNEQKVAFGDARFLGGYNSIALERDSVSVERKVDELERYANYNSTISKPTFHVSLAFHPDETLSDEQLKKIGGEYMERMGYGQQPYLMYRHEDTLHPHMHIVSVSVDDEGKRISDSHNHPRSNRIRKELEIEHNLIKAEDIRPGQSLTATLTPDAIHYGKQETKQAIGNVLQTALKDFSFSGHEDLSVFLAAYNIQLNRLRGERVVGRETKAWSGITFQMTNGTDPVSPAIKASSFAFAPTEQLLAKRFESGIKKNARNQPALLNRIDAGRTPYRALTEATFLSVLRTQGIRVVDTGSQYLYVDQKRRGVFGEKDLPPAYHRSTLQAQYSAVDQLRPTIAQTPVLPQPVGTTANRTVGQTPAPSPYVRTTTHKDAASKKPVTPQTEKTVVSVDGPARPLTEAERISLGKLVTRHYQDYKKENQITYESQLIRAFPFVPLQQRMIASGQPADEVQIALREFERYKTGELALIEARERAYFQQTTQALLRLSGKLTLTPGSRVQFLSRMGLELTTRPDLRQADNPTGEVLSSREQPDYQIVLNQPTRELITEASPPDVPVRQVVYPLAFSREERQLYTALALDKPIPAGITYANVVYSQLKSGLPPDLLALASRALNENTILPVSRLLAETIPPGADVPGGLSRSRIIDAFAERKLTIYRTTTGFAAGHPDSPLTSRIELPAALTAGLGKSPLASVTLPTRPAPVRAVPSARSPSEQQRLDLLSADVLSTTYQAYLVQASVVYESSLLGLSGKLPMTRLTNALRESSSAFPGGPLSEVELNRQVGAFVQGRVAILDTLVAQEEKQFGQRATHYLTMLAHPGITPAERLTFLGNVGIDLVESGTGNQFLVDHQRPTVSLPLSQTQTTSLHKPASPSIKSPLASGTGVGSAERACYEAGLQSVHPILLTSPQASNRALPNPADTRFAQLNVPRLNTLLSPAAWQALSPQLNRNSVDSLLGILSNSGSSATLATQLRQQGYLTAVSPTRAQIRIGHYLTHPDQWHSIPVNRFPALLTDPARIRNEPERITALAQLNSERGQATMRLANALRLGKESQVQGIVHHIAKQASDLRPYAHNPAELLQRLSQSTGPLWVGKEAVGQRAEPSGTLQSGLDKTLRELSKSATNEPGLLDVLGKGMDTSREGKKTHLPDEPRRRRRKR